MNTHSLTRLTAATIKNRSLKIEAAGDVWKKRIKPKIRLTGRWLELAGFAPGSRVEVICAGAGVIHLRAFDVCEGKEASHE